MTRADEYEAQITGRTLPGAVALPAAGAETAARSIVSIDLTTNVAHTTMGDFALSDEEAQGIALVVTDAMRRVFVSRLDSVEQEYGKAAFLERVNGIRNGAGSNPAPAGHTHAPVPDNTAEPSGAAGPVRRRRKP